MEVRFIDVLKRWVFATQTSTTQPTFMNVDELWEVRVPHYTDDALARGHRYKNIIASRLGLAIGVEDICVFLAKKAATAKEQLCLS